MCIQFGLKQLLIPILLCLISLSVAKVKVKYGPTMSFTDSTKCEEFGKYARFNPYTVLREQWFVFYYWAPPLTHTVYTFTVPRTNTTKRLRKFLTGKTIIPIEWKSRLLVMRNQNNAAFLLIERGDRGQYWLYEIGKPAKGMKLRPRDIRLKQTGDNRLLGLMDCDAGSVYVMSKLHDVPLKKHLQDEAARLGYRGRRGRSYLYQGHEWGPIPEDDEDNYWDRPTKWQKKPTKADDISEQSGEVTESPLGEISNNAQKLNNIKVKRESGNSQLTKEQLDSEEVNVLESVLPNEDQDTSNEPALEFDKGAERDFSVSEQDKQEDPITVQLGNEARSPVNENADKGQETKATSHVKPSSESKDTKISNEAVDNKGGATEGKIGDSIGTTERPKGTEDTAASQTYYDEMFNSTSYDTHFESQVTDKPYLPKNYQ